MSQITSHTEYLIQTLYSFVYFVVEIDENLAIMAGFNPI